jgi:hypothetical protein
MVPKVGTGNWEPGRTGPGQKKVRGSSGFWQQQQSQAKTKAVQAGKTTGREEEECGGGSPKCHSDAVIDTA